MNELEYLKKLASLHTVEGKDEGNDEAQRFQNYHKLFNGADTVPFAILYFFYKKWRGDSALAASPFSKQLNKYLIRTRTTRKGKDVRGYKVDKKQCILELNNEDNIWKSIRYEKKKKRASKTRQK